MFLRENEMNNTNIILNGLVITKLNKKKNRTQWHFNSFNVLQLTCYKLHVFKVHTLLNFDTFIRP